MRMVLCAAVLAAGCRRPAPEDPHAWEKNPGIDPRPTGQTLEGTWGRPLDKLTFRLDPARGTKAAADRQPVDAEDDLYLRAARSGQAWAQTKLGVKYVTQSDDIARMGEGLYWLNAAADQNNTDALRVLSALAMEGRGVDQSDKEAYKYMRRAADLGSPEAQFALANMLAEGQGMPRDTEAALMWARKAGEKGFAPAQIAAGKTLLASIEQERKNAGIELLQRAADSGKIEAVLLLASAFGRGESGIQKDEERAEKLLLPYAENGNTDCQYLLAVLYQNGETFTHRRGEARVWLRRAADAGNRKAIEAIAAASSSGPEKETEAMYLAAARNGESWAQTRLGLRYITETADTQRLEEGVRWLKAAAEQNDTEALRALSTLAAQGRGMAQSDTDAYNYMNRAAELGSAEAQYELANILAEGRGVPRDTEAALIWGRKAAEQGYAPAQFSLGRGLINSSKQEDRKEATILLQKAVDQGNVDAVLFLATAVGKGDFGLPKDEARAEALLLPWAEKGNADCQFVLAALYQHGETFAERRSEARSWLQRAADQGHSRALEILAKEKDRTSAQ